MPPKLAEVLLSLGSRPAAEVFAAGRDRLGGSFERLAAARRSSSAETDVSRLTESEVRSWLRSLPVEAEKPVLAIWPSDRVGAEIPFSAVISHFDDLWYPSMDDVIFLWPDDAILIMDHGERFSFVPARAPGSAEPT